MPRAARQRPRLARSRAGAPHSLRARCFGLSLWFALWLGAPCVVLASQAAGPRVLLVGQGDDPFLERVGAEIEKLGFSLVRSDAKGPLDAVARAEHAQAALRVLPSRLGIEVWMADATSGRSLLRQLVVDESPGGPDRELIALQTAELLRTSLLGEARPKPLDPEASEDSDQQPLPETKHTTGDTKSSALQLWCGALYSPGGARAAVELGLSLSHFVSERWGFGVDLGLPLRPAVIEEAEGSAKLGVYFAGVLALLRLQPRAQRFFATVGAGATMMPVRYRGETSEPLRSHAGTSLTGGAYVRGDAGVVAASWLRFGARALAAASFPDISVTFAGHDAGRFGPAIFAGLAFAEVSFL